MRRSLATLGLGLALAITTAATPAHAQQTAHSATGSSPQLRSAAPATPTAKPLRSSVEILNRVSVAKGGYVEPSTGEWVVFRPYYPVAVRVVCPAGPSAGLLYTPGFAVNLGGYQFTCTGQPQYLTFQAGAFNGVNELGWHRQTPAVSVDLFAPQPDGSIARTTIASDSERLWVYTARAAV